MIQVTEVQSVRSKSSSRAVYGLAMWKWAIEPQSPASTVILAVISSTYETDWARRYPRVVSFRWFSRGDAQA